MALGYYRNIYTYILKKLTYFISTDFNFLLSFVKSIDFRFLTDLCALEGPEQDFPVFVKISNRESVCVSVSL